MSDKFWICYTEWGRSFPRKYSTRDEAIKEARRLALLPENIGHKIFVLGVIGFYELPLEGVKWSDITEEKGE